MLHNGENDSDSTALLNSCHRSIAHLYRDPKDVNVLSDVFAGGFTRGEKIENVQRCLVILDRRKVKYPNVDGSTTKTRHVFWDFYPNNQIFHFKTPGSLDTTFLQGSKINKLKLLMLDFDGTIQCYNGSGPMYTCYDLKKFGYFNKGVITQLRRMENDGYHIVIFSNGLMSGAKSFENKMAAFTKKRIEAFQKDLDTPLIACVSAANRNLDRKYNCRKPSRTMFNYFVTYHLKCKEEYIDFDHSMMVGNEVSDRMFAKAIGVRYEDANDFWKR